MVVSGTVSAEPRTSISSAIGFLGRRFRLFFLIEADRAHDVLVVGDVKQPHSRRAAPDHTQAFERQANQLGLIGHQQQLVRLGRGETRHHFAVAFDVVDVVMPWPPRPMRRYS